MTESRSKATAFAPATVANVAVGFDLLGFSLGIPGDEVTVERIDRREVILTQASGVVTELPLQPERNTATAGLLQMIHDLDLPHGFQVSIRKGISLGSGMGGSAASAVGAVVAANAVVSSPLSKDQLLHYALIGEAVASGSVHADNVAPCLFGGLTLALASRDGSAEAKVLHLPMPQGIVCVLIHPHLRINTKEARGILRPQVTLKEHITQSGALAGFVSACHRGDTELLSSFLEDTLIEPQRAHLIPGFHGAKAAALAFGALGCSISGSGPSVFALARDSAAAELIRTRMLDQFSAASVACDSWIIPLPAEGARLIS